MRERRVTVDAPLRLCFVCLGNICRSPIAEAVMRDLVRAAGLADRIEVSSAGTAGWHVGAAPDPRAVEVAARHGVRLVHRGRQLQPADLAEIDLVLALDDSIRQTLWRMATGREGLDGIRLLREFDPAADGSVDIADPYYGSPEDFARVFDEIDASCRGLLDWLRATWRGAGD